MIVDVHTHVFCPKTEFGPQLREDLRRCGVNPADWGNVTARHEETTKAADVAVVFGIQAAATGWHVSNDKVAAYVKAHADRMILFCSIDPAQEGFLDELRRCHQVLGCAGVKISPIYQGVHPLDPRYREIFAYCQKHGLPVLTHMATTFSSGAPLEYARPIHIDQVAIDFPELKIIMAHLGHPWEGEAIAVIRRNQNVYADLSALYYRPWQFYNSMRLLVEYRAEAKLLFGSDFPFTTTQGSLDGLRNLNDVVARSGLPPVSEVVVDQIIHRDTLRLLGLRDPRKKSTGVAHPEVAARA